MRAAPPARTKSAAGNHPLIAFFDLAAARFFWFVKGTKSTESRTERFRCTLAADFGRSYLEDKEG